MHLGSKKLRFYTPVSCEQKPPKSAKYCVSPTVHEKKTYFYFRHDGGIKTGLQVKWLADLTEVDDVPLVHVLDSLADLPHVVDDLRLGHGVALGGDLLEQFPAGQAGRDSAH